MLLDYSLRFLKLLGSASIVIAFSYLLNTTNVGSRLLSFQHLTFSRRDQWYIFFIFSSFSFYNAISITQHGADARIIGPILAGFIAGPIVGTGVALVGILGALLEYIFDISMSSQHTGDLLNSIIATNLIAGFSAGMIQRHSKGLVKLKTAALFVLCLDLFIMIPAELLLAEDRVALWSTAPLIFPPMLIVHVVGVILFLLLIRNFHNEQTAKNVEQKITADKDIAQKIFQSLYSDSKKLSNSNPAITIINYPKTDIAQYTNRFVAQTTVNNYVYFSYGHFFGTQTPVAMAISYLKPLFESLAQNGLDPKNIHSALKDNLLKFSDQNVLLRVLCGKINLRDNVFEFYGSKNCTPLLIRGQNTKIITNNCQLYNNDLIAIVNIETNIHPALNIINSLNIDDPALTMPEQVTDALFVKINNLPRTIVRLYHELACNQSLIGPLLTECRDFCVANGLQERIKRDIGLLLDETVSNAIKYSGIDSALDNAAIVINITFELETQLLEVSMAWKGDYFDPLQYKVVPAQQSRIPGGWGIYLIKKLTDNITFKRKNDYNTLIMQKTYPIPQNNNDGGLNGRQD